MAEDENRRKLGWLGTGRMGAEMALRLLAADCDLAVYNRTPAKAERLVKLGAKPAASAAELGTRDIVFITVGTSDDLIPSGPRTAAIRSSEVPTVMKTMSLG